jgi:ABC-type uncharacterized transport system permease subunit
MASDEAVSWLAVLMMLTHWFSGITVVKVLVEMFLNVLHYPVFVLKKHVFALVSFLIENLFEICSPVTLL